jgi:hypothetical protein
MTVQEWLVENWRANVDVLVYTLRDGYEGKYYPENPALEAAMVRRLDGDCSIIDWANGVTTWHRVPACRCYRCGWLLTVDDVFVGKIVPLLRSGSLNNMRPACSDCV